MKYRWLLAPEQPLLAGRLAQEAGISPLLAHCLLNRGLTEPSAVAGFLDPRLKSLRDPFLLPNMDRAVERLFRARERSEPIVIFGDYDVDGVTSTALLLELFDTLGWTARAYLPNRMDEGYGLSADGVENCLNKYPSTLILAVDCGSTSVDTITGLKHRGVDVIVLDHHQIASPPPPALALVNPQLGNQAASQSGQVPPTFEELCSVGLAFKLGHALVKRGREQGIPDAADFDLRPLLDLVALGTIADIVPLTGENRILVFAGLQRLNNTRRPGLVALKEVSQTPTDLGAYEVAFQLAPRLNAAGRLETAEDALNLLRTPSVDEAKALAARLDSKNRERQQIEKQIVDEAVAAIRAKFNADNDFVIVEGQSHWHVGVVGIVAARVVQQFYRPTIIVGGDGDGWRGSGRSIAGFDLAAALRECSGSLIRHGGHAMAAGLSLASSKLDEFRIQLNNVARSRLQPQQLQPPLRLDAEVGLEEMTAASLNELARLKPTGQGNPSIQFIARSVQHHVPLKRVGAAKQHVKMRLTDGNLTHDAVWWGAGNESLPVGRFDVAFTPEINSYNGRRTVQLKLLDWRPTETPSGS